LLAAALPSLSVVLLIGPPWGPPAFRRNVSPATQSRGMTAVDFQHAGGALSVIDNDFTGACRVYVADATSAPVTASGNIYTTCAAFPR